MAKEPTDRVLTNWHTSIQQSGVARIKLRTLLGYFGLKKRGSNTNARIEAWLNQQQIYSRGLNTPSLDDSVRLTWDRIVSIGDIVAREKDLQDRFESDIMRKLKLKNPEMEYPPLGTRDRIDFLCRDNKGRSVVVELKREAGEKRAVEQVLRYLGHLEKETGHKDPWGILITGCADPDTRRALEGLKNDSPIEWWIYGIVEGEIKLKRIMRRSTP